MAVAGAGSIILRVRWPSQWLTRPLGGWQRHCSSSTANSNAAAADASKKPLSSFFLYMAELQRTHRVPEFRSVPERGKYFGEQWKQLSEQDKEKYKAAAAQSLAEYFGDRNKETLAQPEQAALQKEQRRVHLFKMHTKMLKKERELSQMPQKPLSAYAHFSSDVANSGRRGDASQMDFFRGVGQQWKLMAVEDKQRYIDAAAEQRAKYDVDMESWVKRMEAEGKGHLIPGREPTMNIPRQSPFAQAVIKAVEASTKELLTKKAIGGILNFIGEKLTAIKEADQLDAQQTIHDFAQDWVHLTPAQKKRYGLNPAAPDVATTGSGRKAAGKERGIDSKGTKRSPRKASARSSGSAAAADVKEPEQRMSTSAARQKGTTSRSRGASAAAESEAPTAKEAVAQAQQTKADKDQLPVTDDKPAREKKKRRPVDTSTTSEDSD